MKYLHRLLVVASAAFFIAGSALAQNPGAVTSHAFAIGKGAGQTGFTSLLCASTQLAIGQSAANPACFALSGDITMNASGVTAIGASKVTNSQLATMGANTTKCNATGGTTNPTDCSASTMRTNIGVVIGTDVQAYDADLAALAALTSTGIARRTGSNVWSVGTAVANSELATMAAYSFKVNATGSSATPTDVAVGDLTQKMAPAAGDMLPCWDSAASNALKKCSAGSIGSAGSVSSLNGQTGALAAFFPPQGRLTLVSGTPVMTSSTTGATSIYYTPAVGSMVPIYDGTNTVPTLFTELQITLGNNWTSSTNYDVFIASDSGTTRACTGPAWTAGTSGSATARGTGAGGTELERVAANGLLMNKVQITCRYTNSSTFTVNANRGTYVGTVWIRAADQTIDWHFGGAASGGTAGTFGVWNMYNRVEFTALVEDTFTSAAVSQAAPAALNASNSNRISYVIGWAEDSIVAKTFGTSVAGSSGFVTLGVGHDTTTAISGLTQAHAANIAAAVGGSARFNGDLGFHYVQAVQAASVSNGTIYGSGTVANFHTGIEMSGRF